jgi:predicted peptidase
MTRRKTLAGCALAALSMLCAGDGITQQRGPGGGVPPQFAQGMLRAAPLPAGAVVREYRFDPTGEKLKYVLFVPRKLDKKKPAPLVVALHAAGAMPEAMVNPLAAAASKRGYIIVAPTGYASTGWYGFVRRMAGAEEHETSRLSEIDVMKVLDLVRAEFNIDPRRIYAVGASMGGVGAVHLASKYPDLWAAIGVISPAITANLPEEFESFTATPVVVLHGDHDDGVAVGLVRGWVAGLNARKVPMHYYEYRGGTHMSVVQDSGENVLGFLDKYSRPETPAATAP